MQIIFHSRVRVKYIWRVNIIGAEGNYRVYFDVIIVVKFINIRQLPFVLELKKNYIIENQKTGFSN